MHTKTHKYCKIKEYIQTRILCSLQVAKKSCWCHSFVQTLNGPELFQNLSGNFRAECPDGQAVAVLPLLSSNRLRQQFKLNSS